jgi:hypothetical protein
MQIKLAAAETQKETLIKKKCGNNRDPLANPPFAAARVRVRSARWPPTETTVRPTSAARFRRTRPAAWCRATAEATTVRRARWRPSAPEAPAMAAARTRPAAGSTSRGGSIAPPTSRAPAPPWVTMDGVIDCVDGRGRRAGRRASLSAIPERPGMPDAGAHADATPTSTP